MNEKKMIIPSLESVKEQMEKDKTRKISDLTVAEFQDLLSNIIKLNTPKERNFI